MEQPIINDDTQRLIDALNAMPEDLKLIVKAALADSYRLDFLQALTDKSDDGLVVMRDSTTGRGWRLHETTQHENAVPSVRQALDNFIKENQS